VIRFFWNFKIIQQCNNNYNRMLNIINNNIINNKMIIFNYLFKIVNTHDETALSISYFATPLTSWFIFQYLFNNYDIYLMNCNYKTLIILRCSMFIIRYSGLRYTTVVWSHYRVPLLTHLSPSSYLPNENYLLYIIYVVYFFSCGPFNWCFN